MAADANNNLYENDSLAENVVSDARLTAGASAVQIPSNSNVVRVPVTAGETIQLPFAQTGMLARLDDGNGNLAVKVGDVTVILQGYAAASAAAPVTLIDSSGAEIDVASVIAATDGSIDIQTAAGPAAGDAGTGVDNNGGVFTPFDPAAGIGGLAAVGGLDATELQYGLIERVAERVEEDEAGGVDTLPSLVDLMPGGVVNEDDLEGGRELAAKELDPYPDHVTLGLIDALALTDGANFGYAYDDGNDEFDLDDHEEGSQNGQPLPEPNGNGIDEDREPLTSTAIARVNFFADVPGHLSFSNGTTPILDQLQALNLTSHGQEIKYVILPGAPDTDPDPAIDNSHGETLVAYVEYTYQGEEETYTSAEVIFTIGFREFQGVSAVSEFNIDFTIYSVVDNVAGAQDAKGDLLDSLDIDVPFFMVDSNGSVVPAPVGSANGGLTVTDIDDEPSLEWLAWEDVGEGQYEAVIKTGDTEIIHDETSGVQSGIGAQAGDPDSAKETSAEDDASPDWWNQNLTAEALAAAGWAEKAILGAAITEVNVSFGADGAAGDWQYSEQQSHYVGNKEAGKTVFAGDGDADATAYQLYIGGAGAPIAAGATNWTVTIDGVEVVVRGIQIDANTIIGVANKDDLDGDGVKDNQQGEAIVFADAVPGTDVPVFVLHLHPAYGSLALVQLHQINHGDSSNADDETPSLTIGDEPVSFRGTDFDGDHVDSELTVKVQDDGPNVSVVHYVNQDPENDVTFASPFGDVDEDWLPGGDKDNTASTGDSGGGTVSVAHLTVDFGADGAAPGAGITLGTNISAQGTIESGLVRASDGRAIIGVSADGGQTLIGYADADQDGIISDAEKIPANAVFTARVVGTTVEFELHQALRHDSFATDGVGDGDIESQIRITIPVVVTDADGDKATTDASFWVNDDLVVAADDSVAVSELNVKAEGNIFDNGVNGADRPLRIGDFAAGGQTYSIPPALGGSVSVLIKADGTVGVPSIGVLTVNNDGTWSFSQTKNAPADGPAALNFTYRLIDADGDTDIGTLTVQLKHYEAPSFEDETAIVDEDGISGQADEDNPDGSPSSKSGDDVGGHQVGGLPNPATEAIFRNTLGNSFNWNGDVGTLKFTFDDTQLANIVLLDGTVPTLANVSGNGTDHVIVWAGEPNNSEMVLEITVIDHATAVYEVELHSPMKHPDHDNSKSADVETYYEDDIVVPVTATATNNGGDHSATLDIRVDDGFLGQWGWSWDSPVVEAASEYHQIVDEDQLPGIGNQDKDADGKSNAGEDGDLPGADEVNTEKTSHIATGHLSGEFLSDGPGATPFGLVLLTPGSAFGFNHWGGGDSLMTAAGSELHVLSSTAAKLVIADAANQPVMTLTIDQQTGAYKYELQQPLQHQTLGENNILLEFGGTIGDADGDFVVMPMRFAINDDMPEAKDDDMLVLNQLGLKSGVDLLANDLIGADGGRISKITLNGQNHFLANGSVSVTVTGGTLTVTETGAWSFQQTAFASQAHNKVSFTYTVTDRDGDSATAGSSVQMAVADVVTPVANGDLVISLIAGTTPIPEWALLRNDDADGGAPIDVQTISMQYSGTVGHNAGAGTAGTVYFTDDNAGNADYDGGFYYTVSNGTTESAGGQVAIDIRTTTDFFASVNNEIIIGTDGDNEIAGGGGNDTILGGGGNDTLYGDNDQFGDDPAGIDWLFGEEGNDTLIYEADDKFDGGSGIDRLLSTEVGSVFAFQSTSTDGSHKMTGIEIVDLGDADNGWGNTVTIDAKDMFDANATSINVNGESYNIDLFIVGDHQNQAIDGALLTGFSRLDLNGGMPDLGTVDTSWGTGSQHTYQLWQGTNSQGKNIVIAIEDGLYVGS